MRRVLIAVLVTLASAAGAAQLWSARQLPLPVYGALPAFQLDDSEGRAFRRDDLLGKVSVVDFIFTSCTTACPLLSAEMARLQAELHARALTDRVRLVSISVDPERDTADRLHAYAAHAGAEPALWRFVRGDAAAVRAVVVDGLKQVMEPVQGEVDDTGILHGTRFVLVDERARIRGFYDANDQASMIALREGLGALAAGRTRVAEDAR